MAVSWKGNLSVQFDTMEIDTQTGIITYKLQGDKDFWYKYQVDNYSPGMIITVTGVEYKLAMADNT